MSETLVLESNFKEVLEKVSLALNLKNWSYTQTKFEDVAQNYFGILKPLVMEDTNKKVYIVLKLAPSDERFRVSGALSAMFCKEVFVYTCLLKKYVEFQKLLPLTGSYITPECYYSCDEYCKEVIALQDMCMNGFKPYITSPFLDLDHIILALKSLAKFHALSYILKHRESQFFNNVLNKFEPLSSKSNQRFMEILKDRMQKVLEKFENTQYFSILNYLKHNIENLVEMSGNTENACICHGDIWKENIMFKYKNGKPIEACIIDYQTARLSSPAYDLLFLIFSSTDHNLRKIHFQSLINIYYNEFSHMIKESNLEPDIVYSRQSLNSDMRRVSPACLIIINTAMWLHNGLQQEGHVRSKKVFNTDEEKKKAVETYKKIISDIIDDLITYDFFSIPE